MLVLQDPEGVHLLRLTMLGSPLYPPQGSPHMSSRSPQCSGGSKIAGSPSGPQTGVQLYSDNTTAVAIFQAGRGRDEFIQSCAREVWITCATWDINLVVGHIPGLCLDGTADVLSM